MLKSVELGCTGHVHANSSALKWFSLLLFHTAQKHQAGILKNCAVFNAKPSYGDKQLISLTLKRCDQCKAVTLSTRMHILKYLQ